jgi:ABC-type antimicrobial peptide transport system permease subunit
MNRNTLVFVLLFGIPGGLSGALLAHFMFAPPSSDFEYISILGIPVWRQYVNLGVAFACLSVIVAWKFSKPEVK